MASAVYERCRGENKMYQDRNEAQEILIQENFLK